MPLHLFFSIPTVVLVHPVAQSHLAQDDLLLSSSLASSLAHSCSLLSISHDATGPNLLIWLHYISIPLKYLPSSLLPGPNS